MALTAQDLRDHLNGVPDGDTVLTRLIDAATARVERLLFKVNDADEFPEGTPTDLELAILQLAADWYENREASLVGVSAQVLPFGVQAIVNEYRRYTFGASDNG
jgi:Phage gp6-like head-tail connector protein